jgi:hypothetical protein
VQNRFLFSSRLFCSCSSYLHHNGYCLHVSILKCFALTNLRSQAAQATFKSIKALVPLLDRVLVQRFKPETVRPVFRQALVSGLILGAENSRWHLLASLGNEQPVTRGYRHCRRSWSAQQAGPCRPHQC